MSILEWIVFVTNVVCVALIVFEFDINWPIGVLASATLLVFFWHSKFYAQAALQVFYIVESIYGWWMWRRREPLTGQRVVRISTTSPPMAIRLAVATAVGIAILYPIFVRTSDPFPFWDSAVASASVVAEYMLCFKLIESWPLYLATDIVTMITLALTGYWVVFATYFIFVGLCMCGFIVWRRMMVRAATTPVVEAKLLNVSN